MRKGVVVAAWLALAGCRSTRVESPASAVETRPTEVPLDAEGWSRALEEATRAWKGYPDDATSLAFVLDDQLTDASEMRIARARVEFDGRPITLGGESPRTSVVVRIGAAAPGSPTTLLEDRLRLLVEARAWRRVNDENVADLARETADRCIDEATREVQADQSCVLQRTAAHTATEIPYCI